MFRRRPPPSVHRLALVGAVLCGSLHAADPATGSTDPIEAERVVVEGGSLVAGSVLLDPASPAAGSGWSALTAQTPNLAVSAAGPSSFGAVFALRGLGNTPYFSDPAVGVYFDAIPLGGAFSYPSDFSGFAGATDYAGPQPAGFGRATEAGIIAFAPPPPGNEGQLTLGLGNYQARSGGLLVGQTEGPDADTFLALSSARRSGYLENTEIRSPVDTLRSSSGFLRQRFSPAPGLRINLELLGDAHRDGAAPLVPLGGPLRTVARAEEGATDTDLAGVALQAMLDTPLGTLSETTSATRWGINPYSDWLVLPPPLQSHLTQRQDALNQELRMAARDGTENPWDLGAWLSTGTVAGSSDRSIKGIVPFEVSSYGYTRQEASAYGDLTVSLPRPWSLRLGIRAQTVTKDYHQAEMVPVPDLHFHLRRADEALLPSLKLAYAEPGGLSAWTGVAVGTKPGGFAAYTDNPGLIPFRPETTVALEGFAQRAFMAERITVALHAFDYEIRNYQIERSFSPADYFVANAPAARSTGAEVEIAWRPGTHWRLQVRAGVDRVLLVRFTDPLTGEGEDGKTAPFSPAGSLGLTTQFDSRSGWFAAMELSAFSRTYYSESENPLYSQPAYAVLGFHAGRERKHWRVNCFVQNATDRGYYTLVIPGVNSAAPGPPVTYGAEFTVRR